MSLKKSAIMFYFLTLVVTPLGFLIRILYSKSLTVSDLGLFYGIISLITILSIFVQMGLNQSILYYFPKFLERKEFSKICEGVFSVLMIILILDCIFALFLYLFAPYLAIHYFKHSEAETILRLFLIYFMVTNMINPLSNIFLSLKKRSFSRLLYVFRFVFIYLISLVVFIISPDNLLKSYSYIWNFVVLGMILFYYLLLIYYFPFLRSKPKLNFDLIKVFFKYAFYGLFTNLGTMLLAQIDVLVITYFFTTYEVGLYSNAVSSISILFLLMTPLAILFLPLFSEYKEKKQYATMELIINLLYYKGFYLALPLILVYFLFSDLAISLLFSKEYLPAGILVRIFSLFTIFKVFSDYNFNFLSGLGSIKKTMYITFSIAFCNLVLDIIFVNIFGFIAAAYITILGWFMSFLFSYYYLRKEINLKLEYINFFKILIAGLFFIIFITLFQNRVFIGDYYLNILFTLICAGILYLIIGYLLKIYQFNEIYNLLPVKYHKNFRKIHKKYFSFLK